MVKKAGLAGGTYRPVRFDAELRDCQYVTVRRAGSIKTADAVRSKSNAFEPQEHPLIQSG